MTRSPQVRSFTLLQYANHINKLRKANNKKHLSIEKVAKCLIEAKGDELKKELIML